MTTEINTDISFSQTPEAADEAQAAGNSPEAVDAGAPEVEASGSTEASTLDAPSDEVAEVEE